MTALIAQAAGYSLIEVLVVAIVLIAVVAICYAVAKHFGIVIPPVLIFIFWVCVIAAVAIVAIKFLVGLI